LEKQEITDARQFMSDAKFYEAYSRYLDKEQRYETWEEAVARVMAMHKQYYKDKLTPELEALMDEVQDAYNKKLFLGAQRALQFGGEQLLKHHARLYNCSASYCDRPEFFGEAFYLMLCGVGAGFSVQKRDINKLPKIRKRDKQAKTFIVPDSIEGWAQSVDVLMSSFFEGEVKYPEYQGRKVYFDLTEIRPKGAYISGGFKAPGPDGLRLALDKIEKLIKDRLNNDENTLRPIDAYDITMFIADAVISGGVRRSATVCLFSPDDEEMLKAKTGDWFVTHPARGRSNNSALLIRDEISRERFHEIMQSVKDYGEPGYIFAENDRALFNPCVEIGMQGYTEDGRSGFQFCNLTEVNGGKSTSKEIFLHQCKVAAIMGTLQAGYTDFKYVSSATREIAEREALIGVSITGWMNNPHILFDKDIMREGAEEVKKWNKIVAKMIGINQAARTTCVKPSGNASVLLKTASGIHGEHSPRYLRHVQFNKETEIAKTFLKTNPTMCENSVWGETDVVVAFPVKSPEKSIFKKDLLGVKQLEYVKLAQENWIEYGTNQELCVEPWLRHNVSNTITVDDWEKVEEYIYENRYSFCGVSLLAATGDKAYPQAPFTEVNDMEYIVKKYGTESLFTSALIEAGLNAFNNNLWMACDTALGYGEQLTESSKDLLKRDFVRRFKKFAKHFKSEEECVECLKDVYILHKWWKITNNLTPIDWDNHIVAKKYTDINTTGAQACSGGQCEIEF